MTDQLSQTNTKQIFVTGKMYRGITIYDQGNKCFIYGADNKEYEFNTFGEATAFVDAWYLMQRAIAQLA
jgi:hypothetical protein